MAKSKTEELEKFAAFGRGANVIITKFSEIPKIRLKTGAEAAEIKTALRLGTYPTDYSAMQATRNPIHEAEQAGFDLTLVRESLHQTHQERAERHESALALALELQRLGQIQRAQSQSPATATCGRRA